MTGRTDLDAPGRSPVALMFDKRFGPFFWGKLVSASGLWVFNIGAAVVAYHLTGSAFMVGLVTAMLFAPQLILGPISGRWADQGNAPRQMILGRLMNAAGAGGLTIWIMVVGGVDALPGVWPVLGAAALVGLGFVVGGPAVQSVVPLLLPARDLASGIALNGLPPTIAKAAAPALGGFIATQADEVVAFGFAAGAELLYAFVVWRLRIPNVTEDREGTDFSVMESFRHLRRDRGLGRLLVAISAVGLASEPPMTLAPALADDLGGGPGLVGWLASAFGVGAAVGFLALSPLQRRFGLASLGSGGLALMAGGLVITAAMSSAQVSMVGLAISGVGLTLASTSITTQIQVRTPHSLRGRIMALWLVGYLGSRPLAALFEGWLADSVSVDAALLATAAAVAILAPLGRSGDTNRTATDSGVLKPVAASGTALPGPTS